MALAPASVTRSVSGARLILIGTGVPATDDCQEALRVLSGPMVSEPPTLRIELLICVDALLNASLTLLPEDIAALPETMPMLALMSPARFTLLAMSVERLDWLIV